MIISGVAPKICVLVYTSTSGGVWQKTATNDDADDWSSLAGYDQSVEFHDVTINSGWIKSFLI